MSSRVAATPELNANELSTLKNDRARGFLRGPVFIEKCGNAPTTTQ